MGGFSAFATTALQALSLANTIAGGVDSYRKDSGLREYQQAKERSALELANLRAESELEKQKLSMQQESANEERRQKLRAALASKRAIFGAQGIGSGSGSAQAYLMGLVDESGDEQVREEAYTSLSKRIIDENYSQQQAVNTLKLTQIKEKNKIKRVNALYDTIF